MCSDYFVGIYALSVKVYSVSKQLIASVYSVTITRLTSYYSEGKIEDYKKLLNNVINNILIITIPITFGLIVVSKEVVLLLGGIEYIESLKSLIVLTLSILFAVLGGAFAYCINLPMGKEKNNLVATVISAIENFVLNFVFIYYWKANGAAVTTLLSELTVLLVLILSNKEGLRMIDIRETGLNLIKCFISCLPIVAVGVLVHSFINVSWIIQLVIIILASIVLYFGANIILKNHFVKNFIANLFKKNKSMSEV